MAQRQTAEEALLYRHGTAANGAERISRQIEPVYPQDFLWKWTTRRHKDWYLVLTKDETEYTYHEEKTIAERSPGKGK